MQPVLQHNLQVNRVARRNVRRVPRANASRTVHEEHRQDRRVPLGFNRDAVIVAILENRKVCLGHQLANTGLQVGVNVSRRRTVLATLKASAKLTLRNQPRDVVRTHKVLCHTDDRIVQRLLTVMVTGMLGDIPRKLRNTNLILEIPLERRIQNLPLRDLETVHHIRNRTLQIVVREVDEVLVDKVRVRNQRAGRNQ